MQKTDDENLFCCFPAWQEFNTNVRKLISYMNHEKYTQYTINNAR